MPMQCVSVWVECIPHIIFSVCAWIIFIPLQAMHVIIANLFRFCMQSMNMNFNVVMRVRILNPNIRSKTESMMKIMKRNWNVRIKVNAKRLRMNRIETEL